MNGLKPSIVAACLLALWTPACAPRARIVERAPDLGAYLDSLRRSDTTRPRPMRIQTVTGPLVEGRLLHVSPESVVVAGFHAARSVSVSQIRAVRVRDTHITAGALVGTLLGGVAAVPWAMGCLTDPLPSETFSERERREERETRCIGNRALIVVVAGAGVGAILGSRVARWPVRIRVVAAP